MSRQETDGHDEPAWPVTGSDSAVDDSGVHWTLVYDELRRVARRQLRGGGDTLQATALVHEAYMRLADDQRVSSRGRAYFFGAAARAMRQILVDHARIRSRAKRGGGQTHVGFVD